MKTVLSASLLLSGSIAARAAADFPPVLRESVLEAPSPPANPPVSLVRGAHILLAPGQPNGVHVHPASTVGVVTEGSFVFQPNGEPKRIINTGDVFFEPAGHKILHFDNASST